MTGRDAQHAQHAAALATAVEHAVALLSRLHLYRGLQHGRGVYTEEGLQSTTARDSHCRRAFEQELKQKVLPDSCRLLRQFVTGARRAARTRDGAGLAEAR